MKIENNILSLKQFHSTLRPFVNLMDSQKILINEFNKKVKKGEVELETVDCLCGGANFDLIASVDSCSMLQDTVICKKCGLIQSNPRMTEKEYASFYSSDLYRRCYESDDYMLAAQKRYSRDAGAHILKEVIKFKSGAHNSVLEIGAGGGWNLLSFKDHGMTVTGIDYSHTLTSFGRDRGIDMIQGGLDKIERSFDIIIMNHVLEHLMDPINSLKKIVRHLNDDGLIYIAVPNIMNFDLGQIQNAHTYYFDPKTFDYYCSLAGLVGLYSGVAQEIHMFGIYKAGNEPLPETYLSKHYRKMSRHLRLYGLKQCVRNIVPVPVLKILRKFISDIQDR